jgi:hypothetical protein
MAAAREKRKPPESESQRSSTNTVFLVFDLKKVKKGKKKKKSSQKKKKKKTKLYHWPSATRLCEPAGISRQHFRLIYTPHAHTQKRNPVRQQQTKRQRQRPRCAYRQEPDPISIV